MCIFKFVLSFVLLLQIQLLAQTNNQHNHNNMVVSVGYADSVNNGQIKDTLKKSVPRVAMATIGTTHVHINYFSPGVRDRVIWGGLVAYNTVWVTGAHAATHIQFYKPVIINNQKIEAGTYAIFTIPNKNEWIFILNKNYQQHLTDDYSTKDDILRLKIKPQPHKLTQRLTFNVTKKNVTAGTIEMLWEKIKIIVPFSVLKQ
jgi:hypothetical protein